MFSLKPALRNIATCKPRIEHVSEDLEAASYLISSSLIFLSAVDHNLCWSYYRGVPGQGGLI